MQYRIHHTVLMVFTVLPIAMIASFSADLQPAIMMKKAEPPMAMVFPKGVEAETEVDEMRNIPWFAAGALIGGFACVGFRRLSKMEAARYFGVSVAIALFTAPALVYGVDQIKNTWYNCLCAAGAIASLSWAASELLTMLFTGFKKAIKERGIVGLREQIILILSIGTIDMRPKNATNTTDTSDGTGTPNIKSRCHRNSHLYCAGGILHLPGLCYRCIDRLQLFD